MNIEVRYERSFLLDLKSLEPAAYEMVYHFAFIDFVQNLPLSSLPGLRQIDQEGIFYRFNLENYLIGIEMRGQIIKFLRVIPTPDV
ncbi:hypothetical protein [Calothrix sp. 336/3]|uniref:hypothetical protein n=1 Tax=Calothrix sp. 336/3 TaxID=1337936 RepID=UPI0004E3AB4E|nr:hypothetical protein [Calothrix sp. 336/3]AKG21972.1 cytotoxic translational repressor of toxin-antitoxin stability system [Calothrix sp. 336/3]